MRILYPGAIFVACLILRASQAFGVEVVNSTGTLTINSDRVAHVSGVIGPESAIQFEREMYATMDLSGPRVILIDSPGGSVDYGQMMIAVMEAERAATREPIVCVVRGAAYSMAFNFLTHCDVRLATRDSTLLFHGIAYGGLPPGRVRYTAKMLRKLAALIEHDEEPYAKANRKALHMSCKEYQKHSDSETYWHAEELKRRRYISDLVMAAE